MHSPLPELCGHQRYGSCPECDRRWEVGTYIHLHAVRALDFLFAITMKEGSTGLGRWAMDNPRCSGPTAEDIRV